MTITAGKWGADPTANRDTLRSALREGVWRLSGLYPESKCLDVAVLVDGGVGSSTGNASKRERRASPSHSSMRLRLGKLLSPTRNGWL